MSIFSRMILRPPLLVLLPTLLGSAMRAQETPDNLFQRGVVWRSGPNTCYRFADFTLVAHELEEVGSDLFVPSRPDAGCGSSPSGPAGWSALRSPDAPSASSVPHSRGIVGRKHTAGALDSVS